MKHKLTEERVKGLQFSQNVKRVISKRRQVDKMISTSPICGKMIRALNSSAKYHK